MMKVFKWSFITAIFAYLYLPIAILVINSFNASKYGYEWKGFTLEVVRQVIGK